MIKASWTALLTIGMSLSTAGIADEVTSSNTGDERLSDMAIAVEALHAELWGASRWNDFGLLETAAYSYSNDLPRPMAEFDFRDADALARISRLRSLSLVTFAEIGHARLFFGLNGDGLLGLHFNIFPRDVGEQSLELVRMPYLKENESDSGAEQLMTGVN
jgi:hypothetical protein